MNEENSRPTTQSESQSMNRLLGNGNNEDWQMIQEDGQTDNMMNLRVKTMDSKEHCVEVIANGKVNDLKISIEKVWSLTLKY